jgi:hypothetical protein
MIGECRRFFVLEKTVGAEMEDNVIEPANCQQGFQI